MKKSLFIATTVLFFAFQLLPLTSQAQERFVLTVFGGANFCQIDGDGDGGYSHLGLRGGVGTSFALTWDERSPWRMVVELAFTQKGSVIQHADFRRNIALNYVELPIMMSYTLLNRQLRLAAGVAPAVQVGAKVMDGGEERPEVEALFRRFDWLPLTFSIRYLLTENLAVEGRFQYSMLSVTAPANNANVPLGKGDLNRVVSIGLGYVF